MSTLDMTWERLLVSPQLWLKTLEDEYLHEFIRAGGSAVRVVSGEPDALGPRGGRCWRRRNGKTTIVADLNPGAPTDRKTPDLHRIE